MPELIRPYAEVLAQPAFRRFWIGFLLSTLGNEFTRVAFVWFVYRKTGSAEALGILMVCMTAPILIGGFLAGWLLDAFDRRRVLIADALIRGVAMAVVPLLYAFDRLEVWHVYLAGAIYGFLMMIELAGTPSLIPSLVAPARLAVANALEMLGYTLAGVIGPVLAGVLIAAIGAPLTVMVDVAAYLLFAALLAGLKIPPSATATAASSRRGYGGTASMLAGNSVLLSTTLMFCVFNIGGGMQGVWLPILVDRHLGGGSEAYGALLGLLASGQTVSTLLAGALASRLPLGSAICAAQFAAGMTLVPIFLWPSAVTVALGMFAFGLASAPLTIWAQTLRMAIIPAEMRGRAFALLRLIMQGGRPLGGIVAGLLTPMVGALGTVVAAAALAGLPAIAGLFVRGLRQAGRPTGDRQR
ncbi:MAG: MFS transporter [Alphaproteobacteria bacterium]|nr:MFS transporter [Alphaproteobacteria bacterium]